MVTNTVGGPNLGISQTYLHMIRTVDNVPQCTLLVLKSCKAFRMHFMEKYVFS